MTQPYRTRPSRGFTLIELMIAVAIIAVLARIAFPSFLDSVRKSRRSEGIAELARIQQAEEAWRSNSNSYNGVDVSSASTGLRLVTGTTVATSYTTSGGYYSMSISNASSTGYTAMMSAVSGTSQVKDTNCQCMRVTWAAGNATYETANSTSGSCASVTWVTTYQNSCWKR